MLVFVDYEHASRFEQEGTDWLLAARARITYRLEDLSGMPCHLVRYDRVTPDLFERLGVEAIFISGQGTAPSKYRAEETAAFADIVRTSGLPVFGFCGGWQFMAGCFGAELEKIEVPDGHEDDAIITEWPGGRMAEFGYHPIDVLDGSHPVLAGLSEAPTFRHAHGLHIPNPPHGFQTFASTPATPVQIAIDDERRMVGTQFHPEYWTDEHPDGRTMIENFLRWAQVT